MNYLTAADLRNQAKLKLDGHYAGAILILALGEFLSLMLLSLAEYINLTMGLSKVLFGALPVLVTFLFSVLGTVFQAGYAYFYLNLACHKKSYVSYLWYGFSQDPTRVYHFAFLFTALRYLCLEPPKYLFALALQGTDLKMLSAAFFALALGLVVYVPLSFAFSQCFFLALDFPDKDHREILKTSVRLMKGNYLRYLYLKVSFLPLLLLGILSCGIGFLWIMPYMSMTDACFFLDLMKNRSEEA